MTAVNFISYLRVSTTRQGEHGLGIEAQREAVLRYVQSTGGVLIEEHVEVETGRSATRPILLKSIARCRSTKATLLIARLDRLARSVSLISSLMDGGVDFVATDMPHANKFLIHILSAFAEHERTLISERTRAALAAAKRRGVVLGKNGRSLANQHKAEALLFALTLKEPITFAIARGCKTLAALATALNHSGYRTREGATWSPAGVQKLLRRLDIRTPAMSAT